MTWSDDMAEIEAREPETAPAHGSPAWLEERRRYLGASEVAGALGLSPHEKPLDVWARKLGLAEPRDPSFAMDAGNALEPVILARYAKKTGAILARPGTVRHPIEHWLRASPDSIADGRRNVQVKWVPHARAEWGEEGSDADGVPEWYLVQVQIEMEVIRVDETDVAAMFPGEEAPRIYRVARDPDLAGALVESAREFWTGYVLPGDPDRFPVDGSIEALRRRFPVARRPLAEAPLEAIALAQRYAAARATEAAAAAEKETIGAQLCALIGDAEGFAGRWGSATWKVRKGYSVPAREVEPSRVLRVTLKGE